jgi:putative membrane protein
MYWNDGGTAWMWMLPMMILMVVVVGVIVWAVLNTSRGSDSPGPRPKPTPEDVLADRFAHGEIDADEYRERVDTLHNARR